MTVAVVSEPAVRPSDIIAAFDPVGTIVGSIDAASPVGPGESAEAAEPAVKPAEAAEATEATEPGGGISLGGRLHHAAQAASVQCDKEPAGRAAAAGGV